MTNPATARPLTDVTGLEHLTVAGRQAARTRSSIANNQAVLYLRVSTERQMHTASDIDEDGNSIATQREATLRKARALKATVAEEFIEPGASAQTIAKRPVFRSMLRYIDEHPEVGYVVIYMRSRVFRNFTDAAITKRALLEKGVRLISTKEEFGDGYMADAMEAIVDVMNEVQVRQSGEDIKVKMQHKAQSGGTIGRARLGYLNVRKDVGGRLVNSIDIDPERAPLIQWAFDAYATGNYTILKLQAALAEHGLTTRPSSKRPARPISTSQLALVLRDPYYTGVMPFKGALYPGRHQPLITKELFLRVQDVLAERARRGQRDRTHHHYLKGMLFCGRCADAGRTSRLIFTQVHGNGGLYEYFLCRGRQGTECDLPSLPLAEVESAIARTFGQLELPHDFIDTVRTHVMTVLEESQEADREARARITKQLKKLDAHEERLLDLAADNELNTGKLRERLRTLTLDRARLQESLDRTEADITRGVETILAYLDLLARPDAFYQRASDAARRQLLDAFYATIFCDEEPDAIQATGVERPPVADLQGAVRAMRTHQVHERSPRQEARASSVTSVGSLSDLFTGHGLSKTALVGLTGFEPATP
jgi:site-specific DNA recombinase